MRLRDQTSTKLYNRQKGCGGSNVDYCYITWPWNERRTRVKGIHQKDPAISALRGDFNFTSDTETKGD